MTRAAAFVIALSAAGLALALGVAWRGKDEGARCGAGFVVRGARCVTDGMGLPEMAACPRPLVASPHGCDAPELRVLISAATITLGPSDWEAEGRVVPRSIHVPAFRIDAFEVTVGRWAARGGPRLGDAGEAARAASAMTRGEAAAFCGARGGRLPTEDEWIVAAVSATTPPRRYPWGDTGAVCRRAAWGLATGPCALSADGPDTVGAHTAGDTPLGLHDMAGNVAEWVSSGEGNAGGKEGRAASGTAKGGSWQSALASELRFWARLELPPDARDPRVGARCAYAP